MIPKVRRGHDLPRLMAYLAGPGEANEHTNPHLVAGSSWHMSWFVEQELTVRDARAIGRDLESPTHAHNATVNHGHVWHCPLSIEAAEGQLSDEQWGEIAQEFMTRMGFISDDPNEPSLRWVAVRHGLSKNGNDHIHLAVNLVFDDGSVANLWPRNASGKPVGDYQRAQTICRDLEVEYGLRRVGMGGRSTRGYEPGEIDAEARRRAQAIHQQQHKAGHESKPWDELTPAQRAALAAAQRPDEAVRFTLGRRVRGCSVASADEAEFVRRLRRDGVLVRPWFARGTQDVIDGYRVALRPLFGERPIWFGGGTLGRDLSLPRLREEWPDTPQTASAAAAEWRAAWRGVRIANPGRESTQQPAAAPSVREQLGQDIELLAQRLRIAHNATPALWARTAHQVAGALASWSAATEPTPGPLAAAADAVAASASFQRSTQRPGPGGTLTADNSALLFALVGKTGKARDRIIQAMLLRQLIALGQSIARMHTAIGDVRRAEHINRVLTEQLTPLANRLDPRENRVRGPERQPAEPITELPAAVLASRPPSGSVIPPKLPAPQPAARPWTPPSLRQPEPEQAR